MSGEANVQNGLPGMHVEVSKTYGGTPKAPVLWRGKVRLSLVREEMFDIECSLVDGSKGRFVGMPQREYEANGEQKWASMVFLLNDNLGAAMAEAIEKELGIHEPYEVDQGYNPNESGKAKSNSMPEPDYPEARTY